MIVVERLYGHLAQQDLIDNQVTLLLHDDIHRPPKGLSGNAMILSSLNRTVDIIEWFETRCFLFVQIIADWNRQTTVRFPCPD
jgi:hypothetical protein